MLYYFVAFYVHVRFRLERPESVEKKSLNTYVLRILGNKNSYILNYIKKQPYALIVTIIF